MRRGRVRRGRRHHVEADAADRDAALRALRRARTEPRLIGWIEPGAGRVRLIN